MAGILRRLAKDECGATAIEYGLIALMICVAIVAVIGSIGTQLNTTFTTVNSGFSH
ncbi:MAG: Flp family type IVb pilin [Hyphomicrobiaceae bacterium]